MSIFDKVKQAELVAQKMQMQQMIYDQQMRAVQLGMQAGMKAQDLGTLARGYSGMDLQTVIDQLCDRVVALEMENKKMKQQFEDLKEYVMLVKA